MGEKNPFKDSVLSAVNATAPGSSVDGNAVLAAAVGVLKGRDRSLMIDRLTKVVAAPVGHYGETVAFVAERIGAVSHGPTDGGGGEGVGITLTGPEHDVIVVQEYVCRGLIDDDERCWRLSWNTLHHELAHVHDHATEGECKPDVAARRVVDDEGRASLALAQSLWAEYHASRRAASTYGDVLIHAPWLGSALAKCGRGASLTVLDAIFGAAGYVLGNLAPRGDLSTTAPQVQVAVMLSPLSRIWSRLPGTLDRMYCVSHSRAAAFFDELVTVIRDVWNR